MAKQPAHLPRVHESIRQDLSAALVVFLVAVPLCLGIALASGAPLGSGIIAGIIGGLVVGSISGSHVSVSGPAAGLAVICLDSIRELGSFEAFLVAVALSGLLQIFFGLLRLGFIAEYVPNSVIKGMLAGIGLVIIIKQIPHALGHDTDFEGDLSFWQLGDGKNSISQILTAIQSFHPNAVLISAASLLMLLTWEKFVIKRVAALKIVPPALIAVFTGILLSQLAQSFGSDFFDNRERHFVNLPLVATPSAFLSLFTVPDFSALFSAPLFKIALIIAIIGSIETLLSVEASDKLDPYRRTTSTNRELIAQGVGNIASGLIGGLPVTAVIVRSSANVYAGARTKMSSILHGIMLCLAVALLPNLLNLIPLASLAAILFAIGYKLAQLSLFKQMYKDGPAQFLPFMVTVVAILFTDLLTGVLLGLCVGFFSVIRTNHHDAITVVDDGNYYLLRFNKDLSFINKTEMKEALKVVPDGGNVIIDGTRALYIDHDIYDIIQDFEAQAKFRDILVELKHVNQKSLSFRKKRS